MILLKLCRNTLIRLLVVLVIISSFLKTPAYSQESEDSQIFISGFNAFQQKDYTTTITKMNEVLQKYPDSPLRDIVLFWLSRAYYKNGNQMGAARYMSQFSKEYPDNPLKGTVDEELLALTARYEKGEQLPGSTGLAVAKNEAAVSESDNQKIVARQKVEQERSSALKVEVERKAADEKAAIAKREAAEAEQARLVAIQKEQDQAAAVKAEVERKGREKAEQERLLALQREQERTATLKAEAERKAADEKAVIAKRAAAEAEQARLLTLQREQERTATLKAEAERKAADEKAVIAKRQAAEAEQARLLTLQREQERTATLKAEAERKAADEKAVIARRAVAEAEQARLVAIQKEQEQAAAVKAEVERKGREKAEQERLLALQREQERSAVLKAEEDRKATEKAVQLKTENEKVDMVQVARQQAEMVRLTQAKAEQKRLAAQKAEDEREASAKVARAEQKRIAAAQAEKEQIAAAAEEKRMAVLKAEADKVAAEKAERLRAEREKVEQERKAAVAAESARVAAIQKEKERKASEKAEADRLEQEKIAQAKRAKEEAQQKKLAQLKEEKERLVAQRIEKERQASSAADAAQRAAVKQAQLSVVATQANEQRPARVVETAETIRASKVVLREKAIAQYKSIIEKYPASKAAATAAAKLKELGVVVALPQLAVVEQLPENAQILRLEVAQFAGLEFNLMSKPLSHVVSQRISIPFEITNRGNGSDSFYLESGFPAEFVAGFAAAAQPEQVVNQTTQLAPGESFKGVINLVIPPATIDGMRISYPVKAASRLLSEATQSREVTVTAAAPLLRALVKTDKIKLIPGEQALYRVSVLNVGSTAARDVTFRLSFPPQLEPVEYAAAGFRQEMKSALVMDGLQIKSGENREFSILFKLKENSLAGQELLTRAELINNPLKTAAVFVSNAAHVQKQHGVQVRTASERQVVIPGQTVVVPLVVLNTGNVREKFRIAPSFKGAQEVLLFQDLNRDGVRQANEPIITEVGPLAPQEEASIVMEIKTPRGAVDGAQGSAQIVFSSEGDAARSASGSVQFVYSRPVLQMVMTARDGRLKPGEVASFDLTITNRGSNLARVVELQGAWPEQLELIAADPANISDNSRSIFWKFKEVGAGEKRTIKVSFRVKPGTGVGTNIQVKNLLSYEDQLGNRY